jgi:hypothetical protein
VLGILRYILARGRDVAQLTFVTLFLLVGLAVPAHAGPTAHVDAHPIPVIGIAALDAGPLLGPLVNVIACHVHQSAGCNLYGYVRNSPIIYVDPLGLCESTFGSFMWNLGKGLVVGVVSTAAVAAVAVAATVVAPVAVVTAGVGTLAVVGAGMAGYSIYNNVQNSNWDGLAFDIGTLGGGFAFGGASGGRLMAHGISGKPSTVPRSWNPFKDTPLNCDPKYPGGSFGSWLGSGPTPQSAAGTAGMIGSGVATSLPISSGGCSD